jgi:hypothetical protein
MNINNIEVSTLVSADGGIKRHRESPDGPVGFDTPKKTKSVVSDMSLDTEEEENLLNETSDTVETVKDITMREIIFTIKVHIVPTTYPNHVLSREESGKIIETIGDYIDQLEVENGKPVPKFAVTYFTKGTIKTHCYDDDTVNWLRECVSKMNVSNGANELALKVVLAGDLPSWDIYRTFIRGTQKVTSAQFLSRIKKQNPNLNAGEWACTGIKQLAYGSLVFVQMDPVTLQKLKASDFSAFYLMSRLKLTKYVPKQKLSDENQVSENNSEEATSTNKGGKLYFIIFLLLMNTFPSGELNISFLCLYALSILSVYQHRNLLLKLTVTFHALINFYMLLQWCSSRNVVPSSMLCASLFAKVESVKKGTIIVLLIMHSTCICHTNSVTSLLSELLYHNLIAIPNLSTLSTSFILFTAGLLNGLNDYIFYVEFTRYRNPIDEIFWIYTFSFKSLIYLLIACTCFNFFFSCLYTNGY